MHSFLNIITEKLNIDTVLNNIEKLNDKHSFLVHKLENTFKNNILSYFFAHFLFHMCYPTIVWIINISKAI
jgi:hypothetical protein